MAHNFKIAFQRCNGGLRFELAGDFDGSSALELIHTLQDHGTAARQIVIDTERLNTIHPFGLELFQRNPAVKRFSGQMAYTGKHSETMTPQ